MLKQPTVLTCTHLEHANYILTFDNQEGKLKFMFFSDMFTVDFRQLIFICIICFYDFCMFLIP